MRPKSASAPKARKKKALGKESLRNLAEKAIELVPEKNIPDSYIDAATLIHELRVYQVELEMQNDELRQTQADLENSRSKYSDLYDLAPMGYLTLNKDGLVLEANVAASEMLGLRLDYLKRKSLANYVTRDHMQRFFSHLKGVFTNGVRQTVELDMHSRRRGTFSVQLVSTVHYDDSQNPVCWVSMFDISQRRRAELDAAVYRDNLQERTEQLVRANRELEAEITDRIKAEELLSMSEAYFRALIDNSNDFILVLNEDATVRFASPSVGRILGYERDHLIGKSLFSFLHPDDVPENIEQFSNVANKPGSSSIGISRVRDINGNWYIFEGVSTNMLDDPAIKGVILNAWDVTAWNESQENLRNLKNQILTVREEERAAMAREVHDELGQEITGLRMGLAAIGRKLMAEEHPLAERMTDYIGQIEGMTKTISRIAHGLRSNLPEKIGLVAAVNWECEKLGREHGIKCKSSIGRVPNNLPVNVSANIYRIVQEAFTNVVRHSGARTVLLNLQKKGKNLLLTISDDGMGMTKRTASAPDSFGLMGMRERVVRMGGTMKADCARGKGVTITVNVPLESTAPTPKDKS